MFLPPIETTGDLEAQIPGDDQVSRCRLRAADHAEAVVAGLESQHQEEHRYGAVARTEIASEHNHLISPKLAEPLVRHSNYIYMA
jgi:hypothetical protein